MAKKEANNFPDNIPPSLGPWRFVMTSGMAIGGEVLAVYDDYIVVETPIKETVIIRKEHVESFWEGKGIKEEQKEGEDKA